MAMLRVKYGPCAPLRLSSIESCPATGTTSMRAIVVIMPSSTPSMRRVSPHGLSSRTASGRRSAGTSW